MTSDNGSVGFKSQELDPVALARSVVEVPADANPVPSSPSAGQNLIMWIGATADGFSPWGANLKRRDRQLRNFYPSESYLMSALGVVAARNAAASWTLEGPPRTVQTTQDMVHNSNFGAGWEDLAITTSLDLYTQDAGSFIEFVRRADQPDSPSIALNHLDAARCWATGVPTKPVIYEDRLGKFHLMDWWQIAQLLEMPAPMAGTSSGFTGRAQFSAVTRVLAAAQTMRDIQTYKAEKVSGRFNRAVHLVGGVTAQQVTDALAEQRAAADTAGLMRYIQPLIIGSINPNVKIDHAQIDLASLPEGWDEEVALKLYLTALSMALLTDYQEFAPLPGGNLGSGAQSQILHLKSQGKGPALFQKLITNLMNFRGGVPRNVEWKYTEPDVEAEGTESEIRKRRAEERQIRIQSGEIPVEIARQLAVDAGDLSPELFEAMGGLDLTGDLTLEDTDHAETPDPNAPQLATVTPNGAIPQGNAQPASPPRPGVPAGKSMTLGELVRYRAGLVVPPDVAAVANKSVGPALAVLSEELARAGIDGLVIPANAVGRVLDRIKADDPLVRAGPEPERLELEGDVATALERGLGEVRRNVRRRLEQLEEAMS